MYRPTKLKYFDQYDRTLDKIETLALLAVCRYRMGAEDWRKHLTDALELAGKYGYVRVFSHLGAALLPVLRTWKMPKEWKQKPRTADYLLRVRKAVDRFAALYPDYLTSGGSISVQDLTKKELEILRMMGRGKSDTEIREVLGVTANTLKTHNRKLFKKLGVNSRSKAVSAGQRLHLI